MNVRRSGVGTVELFLEVEMPCRLTVALEEVLEKVRIVFVPSGSLGGDHGKKRKRFEAFPVRDPHILPDHMHCGK